MSYFHSNTNVQRFDTINGLLTRMITMMEGIKVEMVTATTALVRVLLLKAIGQGTPT